MYSIVKEFEDELKELLGVRTIISVNSGTSALIAVLASLDLKKEDEVILPPFTYQATLNAILLTGGTPNFIDIGANNLIDQAAVLQELFLNSKVKVVMPVHLFGRVWDFPLTKTWLETHKSDWYIKEPHYYIEDAAQAFLAKNRWGEYAGTQGDAGCFSFFRSKNLSTFEGGAIAIPHHSRLDDEKIRAITDQGQVGRFNFQYVGYNFRMSEPCAQYGLHQLKFHKKGVEAELGKYDEKDGYYPFLVYDAPAFRNKNISFNHCPNAEKVAQEIRNGLSK